MADDWRRFANNSIWEYFTSHLELIVGDLMSRATPLTSTARPDASQIKPDREHPVWLGNRLFSVP
jgi:hypothetical protein